LISAQIGLRGCACLARGEQKRQRGERGNQGPPSDVAQAVALPHGFPPIAPQHVLFCRSGQAAALMLLKLAACRTAPKILTAIKDAPVGRP
jgi:hypothetical protein